LSLETLSRPFTPWDTHTSIVRYPHERSFRETSSVLPVDVSLLFFRMKPNHYLNHTSIVFEYYMSRWLWSTRGLEVRICILSCSTHFKLLRVFARSFTAAKGPTSAFMPSSQVPVSQLPDKCHD
jgi:hypothetical protein